MQSMSNLKLVRKDNKISSANNEILQNVKKLFFRSKFIIVGLNDIFCKHLLARKYRSLQLK